MILTENQRLNKMNVDKLIQKIEQEQKVVEAEHKDAEGLMRLQEVAAHYKGEYELIWSGDLLEECKKEKTSKLYPTKVSLLDNIIDGFREQQLVTLSGDSGHGKSAFGIFLVKQMEELSPVVIPLEQSNEELVSQLYENGYYVPRFLSPKNLADRVTVEWIEYRIIEGIAKYNTKFVLIDHLGYIDDMGENNQYSRETSAYRIEMLMKGLKNVAKRWNVVIVLLVHISQHDESKPPSLKDLKGSSSIKQESDMVMMIWRKNYLHNKVRIYENETMLSVQKNRRTGRNGNVGLVFNSETGEYIGNNGWVEAMEQAAKEQEAIVSNFDDIF